MLFESTIRNKIALADFRLFAKESLDMYDQIHNFGNGYDSVFLRIEKVVNDLDENKRDEFFEKLTLYVRNRILFNYKIRYTFQLSAIDIQQIFESIKENEIFTLKENNDDSLNLLNISELKRIPFDNNDLISTYLIEDELACLVFSSKHSTKTKVEIDKKYITIKDSDFSEVYGMKQNYYQNFDIVIIDTLSGQINFCIDNSFKLSEKLHGEFYKKLRSKFISLFQLKSSLFESNFNFFPLVKLFYESEIGRVKELGFKTDTGSSKQEQMRSDDDLRRELFHSKGSEYVKIEPYLIELALSKEEDEILFKIPAREQSLSVPSPKMIFCEVRGVFSIEYYNFLHKTIFENELLTY